MIETLASPAVDAAAVETLLREDLAQGDAMLASVSPILRHMLGNQDSSLFSEEVVARIRGMLADLARQLIGLSASQSDAQVPVEGSGSDLDDLTAKLGAQVPVLSHLHALALEFQLAERLQTRLSLDPVLSPLLQALIASPQSNVSADAMALLASQARFVQAMRRMQLPLTELPGDLLHIALLCLGNAESVTTPEQPERNAGERTLRENYDESRTRLGQLARIVAGLGAGVSAALSPSHAGAAIFLTALGLASGQDRETAVLATGEGQMARLALALRAAGLKPEAIEEQFLVLHPDAILPAGFNMIGADRAAAILARSGTASGF